MAKKLTYVDLFCGAGGFAYGFDSAGFKNVFSIDFDKNFSKTYRRNFPSHHLIERDISLLSKKEIKKIIGNTQIDVVIGGPPCQGFSIAGNIGRRFLDDERNKLFNEFVRVVSVIKPRFFVMENVARLFTHNKGKTKEEIISSFNKIGYDVECTILNSADFGVPQLRRRVIFFGKPRTSDSSISFPKKNMEKYKNTKEAIGDLAPLEAGQSSDKFFNHVAMKHSEQMLKKMKFVSEGGNRREIPHKIRPKKGDVRKYIRYNSSMASITVTGDMRKFFIFRRNGHSHERISEVAVL